MLFAISLLVYAMGGLGTSVAVLNRQLAIPSRKKKSSGGGGNVG